MKYYLAVILSGLVWVHCTAQQAISGPIEDWDKVLAKARQEGVVVLGTNLGLPKFRQSVTKAFKGQYGFDVEIRSMKGAELTAIAGRECAAGRPSMDVLLSGNSELITLYPKGCLAPLKQKLLLPEVVDSKNWRGGFLKFNDPEEKYMLQMAEYYYAPGIHNKNLVKAEKLKSIQSLVDPKYKGKIASFDPRRGGAGQAVAAYLLVSLGDEFISRLYARQKVTYTTNHRQLADWIARGNYAIGLGAAGRAYLPLMREGLPIGVMSFDDIRGEVVGGSSVMKLVKDSPHPNAATILLNWLASKEGQGIFERYVLQKSRRLDVRTPEIPDFTIPKPNLEYHDGYSHKYYAKERRGARKRLLEILGR